jgi:segregation and condensation protein B
VLLRVHRAILAACDGVIRKAADVGDQLTDLNEFEVAVLASIAYHQPLTRDGLKDIFG